MLQGALNEVKLFEMIDGCLHDQCEYFALTRGEKLLTVSAITFSTTLESIYINRNGVDVASRKIAVVYPFMRGSRITMNM